MRTVHPLTEKDIQDIRKSLIRLSESKYRKTRLPLVTLKCAQTLDGKIATITGDSRWISGPSFLRLVHRMRSCHDAVLVGVNTVIRDDPQLTVRLVKGKNPRKIILDSRLRTPLDSKALEGRSAQSTIIATTSLASKQKTEKLRSTGAEVWTMETDSHGQVDLRRLLERLGQAGIRSIMIEGGSKVIGSFLDHRLIDHLLVAIAPKIMGRGIAGVSYSATGQVIKIPSLCSVRYFATGEDIILQALLRT